MTTIHPALIHDSVASADRSAERHEFTLILNCTITFDPASRATDMTEVAPEFQTDDLVLDGSFPFIIEAASIDEAIDRAKRDIEECLLYARYVSSTIKYNIITIQYQV